MKIKILLLLPVIFFFLAKSDTYAKVDPLNRPNNKYGIHLLFPEEIFEASKLVNSSGGDWGYVTIPIQSTDKNLIKWQKFMDDAKKLHLIPLVRLMTYPITDYWPKPDLYDSVDFANFLDSLIWPVKNRYIILYNEPNRAQEWGGEVRPDEYALFCQKTIEIFKARSQDFFMLNGGLDVSVPNSNDSMDWQSFLFSMNNTVPGIFSLFDGWTSHAYPNPAFISSPYNTGNVGIRSYQYEIDFIQNDFGVYGLKVFITETGWDKERLGEETVAEYYKSAFNDVWNNDYLVAVTPFLLSAQAGDFKKFTWMNGGEPSLIYQKIKLMKKNSGNPERDDKLDINAKTGDDNSNWSAQKTNIWSRTSKDYLKKILRWLNIKKDE